MDKEALFVDRLPQDDVEVPGLGTFRVRALSRAEAQRLESAPTLGDKERIVLSCGVVDPALTEADAKRWLASATFGEVDPVMRRIAQLSGLLEDSAKAAYKSDGDGSDA
jgi:hypothetical protein